MITSTWKLEEFLTTENNFLESIFTVISILFAFLNTSLDDYYYEQYFCKSWYF